MTQIQPEIIDDNKGGVIGIGPCGNQCFWVNAWGNRKLKCKHYKVDCGKQQCWNEHKINVGTVE